MRAYLDAPIDRHGTNCEKWDKLEEYYGRGDLLAMWVADMDFRTVPQVREALVKRAEHAIYGYTDDADAEKRAEADWLLREKRTRSYFGKRMSEGYYAARDALETAWLSAAKNADDAAMAQLSAKALEEELAFYADYPTETFSEERCSHGYHAYWKKKNALLGCPRDEKSGKQLPR